MKPSKKVPIKVWLTAQRSIGLLLVGGNHTSSRSLARRVFLRALAFVAALLVVPLLQIIYGSDPKMLYTLSVSDACALESGFLGSFMFLGIKISAKEEKGERVVL
ncbi:hypothetical protein V6N13_133761 [Hibiscus sabdariffa]